MTKRHKDGEPQLPHENPDVFRDLIEFTAARTGFPAHLIEKDYFCSLVLAHLFGGAGSGELVFKGGTALNKVHFGFYRLSEDLDFSVPVELNATRGDRRKGKAAVEKRILELTSALPTLSFSEPWTGANNSTQYLAEISYPSVITNVPGRIKIDTGLREPVLSAAVHEAACLLLDPITRREAVGPLQVRTMNVREAMAEKSRAALARLTPAIRDVFDLWFAREKGALPSDDAEFVSLIKTKLAIPGNAAPSASKERRDIFRAQLETDLRPVLRPVDYERFDFNEGWEIIEEIARAVLKE